MVKIYNFLVKKEKFIFLFFLLISLFQFWSTKYIPSLDGPQHLYNANVLVQLILKNEFFEKFYSINEVIVGYWSGHFFLSFFKFFFPAWLAEKIFLTTYLISFIFSFRYAVRSINPAKGNFISYLSFLFAFHSYLVLGYYSFSIAAIFFFIGIGFWFNSKNCFTWKKTIVFMFILIFLFLSHAIVFSIFGLSLFALIVADTLSKYENGILNSKVLIATLGRLFLSIIPSLLLFFNYIIHVMEINSSLVQPNYSLGTLVIFLTRIRQLVGFDHEIEAFGYVPIFLLMFFLTVSILYKWSKQKIKTWRVIFKKDNSILLASGLILLLYFLAPDKLSAGNLTNRFGLYFYLTFIFWLSVKEWRENIKVIFLVVLTISTLFIRSYHHLVLVQHDKVAQEIESLQHFIPNGAVIDCVQESTNWLQRHFQLYSACDKDIISLSNPQCNGQFPIIWDTSNVPRTYIGEQLTYPFGLMGKISNEDSVVVDFISVLNYKEMERNKKYDSFFENLKGNYKPIYKSESVLLYQENNL